MAASTTDAAPPAAPADAAVPAALTVVSRRRETADTATLELEVPAGVASGRFAPGQFNMVYVFGAGEVPLSISGDPSDDGKIVHTYRAVGATTEALDRVGEGDAVGVRGPYGTPWPLAEARGFDLLIVAGGIGLAAVRALVLAALARRSELGDVVLLVGARSPDDLLYQADLDRWRREPGLQLGVTVDHADLSWSGSVGVVTELLPRARFDPGETVAMICGPEVMMRYAARELIGRGVEPERVYVSMERNMKCAVGMCGHCQLGAELVCKDGPVFPFARIAPLLGVREL